MVDSNCLLDLYIVQGTQAQVVKLTDEDATIIEPLHQALNVTWTGKNGQFNTKNLAIGFTYEGVGERNKVVLANVQLAYQPSCMYAGKKIANFM